ncbi:MAG: MFS transporter [Candidatus Omnitrophica bacterium]|nr:MFS transporter [Candidatus Omnitrophota bacterium]
MRRPSLLVIFLTVFVDLIGFGIVMPLLPIYSPQIGEKMIMIGLIISSFSVMQFIFSPIWGRLSDRLGRRPVLLLSLAGEAISYVIFTLASTLTGNTGMYLLLASRTFAGICGGNITVAQAYIADITPPDKRSARMGLIGVAFGLGFIFGPPLGALSARFGLAAPGWVAMGLCTLNLLLACVILPESWQPTSALMEPRPRLVQWMHTLSQPQVGLLIMLFFMATFCFTCFETTLALLANRTFKYDESHVGYLFAYGGVISAFIQGGLIKRLVNKMGEARLILFSFIMLGISLIILPFVNTLTSLLIGLALLAVGSSTNRPPIFGMISILTPSHEQGSNLGVAQSAGSLSRIMGPIFSATLFTYHPPRLPGLRRHFFSCRRAHLAAPVQRQTGASNGGFEYVEHFLNPAMGTERQAQHRGSPA